MKYIPCSTTRTLQRCMDIDTKGIIIEDTLWNVKGVPSLMTDDKLEKFVVMCSTKNSGMTHCKSSLEVFILSKNRTKLEAVGFAAFGLEDKISESTVPKYMSIIACHPNIHVDPH